MQLFAEIFPLEPSATQITAYALICDEDMPPKMLPRIGRAFIRRLKKAYPGAWLWSVEHNRILTTETRSEVELTMLLDFARDQDPDLFIFVDSLLHDLDCQLDPRAAAEFVLRTRLADLKAPLDAALKKFKGQIKTGAGAVRLEREHRLTPLDVNGQPAIALSISAKLVYEQDAQSFADASPDPKAALVGLRATEKFTGISGDIVKVTGTVGERREKMLERRALRAIGGDERLIGHIQTAPDDQLAVRLRVTGGSAGERKKRPLELPASALEPLIRPADFGRFGLDAKQANAALRPDPAERSAHVKALSDIAKDAGILARAYSARDYPKLFIQPEFDPYLRFNNKRTRPYKLDSLAVDFRQLGAYHVRDAFKNAPIRAAVVNVLGAKLDDFLEAMNRMLAKNFDFTVEVLRERKVRVVSLPNVAAAIDVVEGEKPDIVLVFLPDQAPKSAEDEDLVAYIKSLTMGRGLPAHVISQSTLDDPESMPAVIMSILARTGNTPFALADPLEFADYVVGLDAVRQSEKDGTIKLTAVARIYRADGIFVRWAVRSMTLNGNEPPYVLMRDLFPQRDFAKQRVLLHTDGRLSEDVKAALNVWGKALGATFWPVEMVRRGAPRLYAFDEGKITAPPQGSAFKLNADEAFFVLSHDPDQPTPQPQHVFANGLPIEQALHSLRAWTLLSYTAAPDGHLTAPPLPVSVQGAGELAYWLRKGNTFPASEGEVPFWL